MEKEKLWLTVVHRVAVWAAVAILVALEAIPAECVLDLRTAPGAVVAPPIELGAVSRLYAW